MSFPFNGPPLRICHAPPDGEAGAGAGDGSGAGDGNAGDGSQSGSPAAGASKGAAADGKGAGDQAAGGGDGKGAVKKDGAAGDGKAGAGDGAGKGDQGPKIPDKFLVDGKLDQNKLLQSYSELERAQFRRREEVRAEARKEIEDELTGQRPATPGDYKVAETFKIGDREIQLNTKDPMLDWLKETAHRYNIPNSEIDGIIQGYVGQMIAAAPAWSAEAEQLGVNADARHARVDGWLKGNLSKENYNTFATMPATARMIKAVEELMTVAGSPPVSEDKAELPGEVFSRDELKAMMRDPRYSGVGGKIDQAYVHKVRAGFQRLNNGRS